MRALLLPILLPLVPLRCLLWELSNLYPGPTSVLGPSPAGPLAASLAAALAISASPPVPAPLSLGGLLAPPEPALGPLCGLLTPPVPSAP